MKKVGNYVLLSELGKGQFGVVYKARHSTTDEIFAIKSINRASLAHQAKLKELFDTEVKIMSNIKHPNIMHLYELLETNNNYYLVLDYCRSGDMEGHVEKHKGLGEVEAVYLLKQIMNGFKELHKHKIMHRDFKLANIFLNDDTVVIGDFGFAKSGIEMANTKLGSPITMAPEILLNTTGKVSYTNKADLWSIGVCFFTMIFGVDPWPNIKSVEDLRGKVVQFSGPNLQFPTNTRFKITPECKDLLIKLIEIDPKKRIDWDAFYNHKLFQTHDSKKNEHEAMQSSIMFKNNKDNVDKLFNQNRMDKGNEFDLNMDPNNITGFQNIAAPQAYAGVNLAQRNKQRILDRFTHEKRIVVFLIQTSVKLRNLSKEKTHLNAASKGFMYCGVFLLKKAILLNTIALDCLKKGTNVYQLQEFENFVSQPERQRLIDELEYTDIPTYQKLFSHLIGKFKDELNPAEPRTAEVIRIVEDPNPQVLDRVEAELRKETFYLVEYFSASYNNLPSNLKMDMQQALAQLYISSRHKEQLPFLQDGIPFDWYMFEKSFDGPAGVDRMNKLLNRAFSEK